MLLLHSLFWHQLILVTNRVLDANMHLSSHFNLAKLLKAGNSIVGGMPCLESFAIASDRFWLPCLPARDF